jgi:hypothetical protein
MDKILMELKVPRKASSLSNVQPVHTLAAISQKVGRMLLLKSGQDVLLLYLMLMHTERWLYILFIGMGPYEPCLTFNSGDGSRTPSQST